MDHITRRILRQYELEDAYAVLAAELPASELQSLLLALFRDRSSRVDPTDLLRNYRTNRFCAPAVASPQVIAEIVGHAYALLSDQFEMLELSPLTPFGTASALGPVDQNNVVTALRNTEVCSDITNVLALECAKRRSERPDEVRLAAAHRLTRAQAFTGPISFAHFAIFSLVSAGRDEGHYAFEVRALLHHLTAYVSLLDRLKSVGYSVESMRAEIAPFDKRGECLVREYLLGDVQEAHPTLPCEIVEPESEGSYYSIVGVHLHATNGEGQEVFLADMGFNDWTQKLLSNAKERLLTSGIGVERIAVAFAPDQK